MDEIKAKQQVIEKIKAATKILVTVSDSPSVDALSAALALSMLLDKKEKYATAIFSGETPPAIAFLEPEKTFDDTTDSLRDFIIALNKEKADHLRYKVEGDAVKIFITPYKTTISQDDLDFSQGDYNVELVIALGVDNQDHLDGALQNHGKILHDASIVTMTAGDTSSSLGGVDWHDAGSSSLSEMVAGLAEAMKDDKKKSLLDAPIATALLTGIVAETDRFSNEHTTSKALTVAANLMAAGADQQLIANELRAAHTIEVSDADETPEEETPEGSTPEEAPADNGTGGLSIKHDEPAETPVDESQEEAPAEEADGETLAELDERVRGHDKAEEKANEERNAYGIVPEAAPAEETPAIKTETTHKKDDEVDEPELGGALNATAEQAAEDARHEAENDQNRTILSHSYVGSEDPATPGSVAVNETPTSSTDEVHSAYALNEDHAVEEVPATEAAPAPLLGGERVIQPPSEVPQPPAAPTPEVSPAPEPGNPTPADLGLPLPPPVPDFSQFNGAPAAPAFPVPEGPQPERLGDILAPEPVAPSAPAPNSAYAAPELEAPQQPIAPPEQQPPQADPSDPGQFQIPSQQ